ncbi:hypothetical protein [Microtetraspora sp. NBRC 13810]|uniref:hypothetical protein n=1 Tax=Microtetraspora sp. NBRC 13810 TaxID=3030990 RepID=UPI0025532B94|nr:hypothetical protein [Microtetraspora sp. NBRC 13810]
MKVQLARAAERVGPMADNARDVAATRIVDARTWAAPRLDRAAHTVEDQLAPRVSMMLSEAAKKVDPAPVKRRRWPMLVFLSGLMVGAAGYMMYRKNAQQWTDTMKDSAVDASQWAGAKSERTGETVSDKVDTDHQGEDASKRPS